MRRERIVWSKVGMFDVGGTKRSLKLERWVKNSDVLSTLTHVTGMPTLSIINIDKRRAQTYKIPKYN